MTILQWNEAMAIGFTSYYVIISIILFHLSIVYFSVSISNQTFNIFIRSANDYNTWHRHSTMQLWFYAVRLLFQFFINFPKQHKSFVTYSNIRTAQTFKHRNVSRVYFIRNIESSDMYNNLVIYFVILFIIFFFQLPATIFLFFSPESCYIHDA